MFTSASSVTRSMLRESTDIAFPNIVVATSSGVRALANG